jgi:DNA polymerase-3 subunit epsilon
MLRLRLSRLRYRRRLASGALAECWRQPWPSPRAEWRKVSYLVLDAEMSALDPKQGELLSLGWVLIDAGAIDLGSARHRVLRPQGSVGQSAVIHQLRDVDLSGGETAEQALQALLSAARGRVLVLHNAALDLSFLDPLAQRCHGAPLLLPCVDTLRLEQRQLARRGVVPRSGDLSLSGCRARYGLGAYTAHNALEDALATAELLLAHASSRGAGIRLGDLL